MRPPSSAVYLLALTWTTNSSALHAESTSRPDQSVHRDPVATVKRAVPRAVDELLAAAGSLDPLARTHTMEAAEHLPIERAMPLLQLGLEDPIVPVQFAALATIGKLRLDVLIPAVEQLADATSPYVQAAALFALHACRGPADLTPLAAMLQSDDPALRGSVAMLLGMSGDNSAVFLLRSLSKVPLPGTTSAVRGLIARLQIAEARALLGDDTALSMIRGGLYSEFDEVRVLAAMMLGRIGDHNMEEAFFNILQTDRTPIELKLAAVGALAQIADRVPVAKEMLESVNLVVAAGRDEAWTIRLQAAHVLGSVEAARRRGVVYLAGVQPPEAVRRLFAQSGPAQTLVRLLDDQAMTVRLAAAASILALSR